VEDPARGWAALGRAVPAVSTWRRRSEDLARQFDAAVADDRYAEAARLLGEWPADHAGRDSAKRALDRLGGDLVAVASSNPHDARGRRAQRLAQRDIAVLGSVLPIWAYGSDFPVVNHDRVELVQPLRILHVVTNSLPLVQAGSTIRTQRVARAMRDRQWDAHVVTRPGFPVFHGDVMAPECEVVDSVPYHRLLPGVAPSSMGMFEVYPQLLQELTQELHPHILHAASDHVNARAALEVGRRSDIPVAYEARTLFEETWAATHGGDSARDTDSYRLMRSRHDEVLRAADVVTTLGEGMRTEILNRGVAPERVFVVPNAVSDDFLTPVQTPGHAREALGIAGGDLLVGSVTTLYPYEGLGTLIEAVALLRHSGVDARVLLVGDGPERMALLDQAARLGVPIAAPGRVAVSAVRDYFDALDVFALPRIDDPVTRLVTALKPLEAQARAVPVVGSDIPAVAEVLAPGSTLVDPSDPHAWADALLHEGEPGIREATGVAAREWVRACRTWPSVMTTYASAYASLGYEAADV
jgi:glycosyltransferase involved in cell wall biosynthesis